MCQGRFYRLARSGDPNPKREQAGFMSSGWIGTIIGVLLIIILVIVVLNLT